ncbi:17925_t:CDS:2, partial [Cetraspora pellucida]
MTSFLNLVTDKEEATKYEQKEKQALKEVFINKINMSKDTTNITTNNTSKEQIISDNTVEIEDTTRQKIDEMANLQSN